jgi:hypothetical protein
MVEEAKKNKYIRKDEDLVRWIEEQLSAARERLEK